MCFHILQSEGSKKRRKMKDKQKITRIGDDEEKRSSTDKDETEVRKIYFNFCHYQFIDGQKHLKYILRYSIYNICTSILCKCCLFIPQLN